MCGVRRDSATRWVVTPETKLPDLVRLLSVYEDERDRLGRPQARHPLRREIVPGRTTDEAYARFEAMAKDRLIAYAQRSLATRNEAEIAASFREVAAKEAFVGTPAQCVAQIAALAEVLPIDPVIVRAQWPDMTADQVVAYLDDLGKDVIPAVREITPVARVVRSGRDCEAAEEPVLRARLGAGDVEPPAGAGAGQGRPLDHRDRQHGRRDLGERLEGDAVVRVGQDDAVAAAARAVREQRGPVLVEQGGRGAGPALVALGGRRDGDLARRPARQRKPGHGPTFPEPVRPDTPTRGPRTRTSKTEVLPVLPGSARHTRIAEASRSPCRHHTRRSRKVAVAPATRTLLDRDAGQETVPAASRGSGSRPSSARISRVCAPTAGAGVGSGSTAPSKRGAGAAWAASG